MRYMASRLGFGIEGFGVEGMGFRGQGLGSSIGEIGFRVCGRGLL